MLSSSQCHRYDAEKVIEQYKSDPNAGLDSSDVSSLRGIYGSNKLEEEEKVIISFILI